MGEGIEQPRSGPTTTGRSGPGAERVFGGWALILGGALLFGALLPVVLLPAPPASPAGIARWVDAHTVALSISDEFLFFAVVCLTPAVVVLFRTTRVRKPLSSLVGASSLLLAIGLLAGLVVVTGRLVYPVFGIALSAETLALVVSLLFGMLHAVLLLLGVALGALAAALRPAGRWLPVVSVGAAALQVLGAFPWLIPAWLGAATAAALLGWTSAVGWWLVSARSAEWR